MITITYEARLNGREANFRFSGLQSDEKPIETYNGAVIANGSVFLEMDTGVTYDYDAAGKSWVKRPGGGGAGNTDIDGDGTPDSIATNGEVDELIDDIFG